MPVLLFFIFVGMVGFFTLGLAYGLSPVEERAVSRRCRRRRVRRLRVHCSRFEG